MSSPHRGQRVAVVALAFALAAPIAAAHADPLVHYDVVDKAIPQSLTGVPGDPANGRKLVIDRARGNCLACHEMPIPEQDFQGTIGPDLKGVADRLTEGQLRLRVVDAKAITPDSVMPAFYRTDGLYRVADKLAGKPIFSAQEVEDVVAYLETLK
ncbi:MAG: sulfur oxidation c-type cytochrome SoxX [Magnetospirillum sp.]|nr:sulfur oxidation c-type cytochrome SoxX [Magnetospirillum sp.]